ncbi:protein FAM151A-like isoform X1 [Lingula anatina]|uniref:Protein FAM151A-like isoform X1 n=1 Tax=Lingula anatina TaxID=7574 RepID=A0A2R2MJQ0_LINAN|nr:protein FAM151A-like isoform X1 [Lingula anatina]|eukprot:XP_023930428.1 protein FAM151A-like isoform X1 [Lingula anatina]
MPCRTRGDISGAICCLLMAVDIRKRRYASTCNRKRIFCCVGFALLLLVICIILVAVFVVVKKRIVQSGQPFASMDTLQFFNVTDGLAVTWYNGDMSKKQMEDVLSSDAMMLEADVTLGGSPSGQDETTVPSVARDNTLQEWMEAILDANLNGRKKGVKLNMKHDKVIGPTLKVLQAMKDSIVIPVWIHADILLGPGTNKTMINPMQLFSQIDQIYPAVTLSVAWASDSSQTSYTQSIMEEMYSLIKNLKQPVSITVRAALVKNAWPNLKWLLSQNSNFTLTVWNPSGVTDKEGTDLYDLLYVRNNWYIEKIFYDLPGTKFKEFQELSVTAGSPLNFFDVKDRDAIDITWAHAANSIADMEMALKSDVMMLEADILLRGQGTASQTDIPIMAHPPAIDSDNTFQNWFTNVVQTKKGLKLDFKSIGAVEPCLQILNSSRGSLRQPVWLNADILVGPNAAGSKPVDAAEFISVIQQNFPQATLSIGWKTAWNNSSTNEGYTQAMVEEMAGICINLTQPITFPVRAIAVRPSWPQLKWLLDQSLSYSLTIWTTAADDLKQADMQWVRDQGYDEDRIYYDLPDSLMPRRNREGEKTYKEGHEL